MAAAKKKPEPDKAPTEGGDDEAPAMFFDWDGRPAYRDEAGITAILPGGEEKPITDLWKFIHEAVPVSEEDFEKAKTATSKGESKGEKGAGA